MRTDGSKGGKMKKLSVFLSLRYSGRRSGWFSKWRKLGKRNSTCATVHASLTAELPNVFLKLSVVLKPFCLDDFLGAPETSQKTLKDSGRSKSGRRWQNLRRRFAKWKRPFGDRETASQRPPPQGEISRATGTEIPRQSRPSSVSAERRSRRSQGFQTRVWGILLALTILGLLGVPGIARLEIVYLAVLGLLLSVVNCGNGLSLRLRRSWEEAVTGAGFTLLNRLTRPGVERISLPNIVFRAVVGVLAITMLVLDRMQQLPPGVHRIVRVASSCASVIITGGLLTNWRRNHMPRIRGLSA